MERNARLPQSAPIPESGGRRVARRDCSANKVGKLTGSRPTELVRIVQTYAYFVLWLGLIRLFRDVPVIGDGEDAKNRDVFGETGLTRADRLLI